LGGVHMIFRRMSGMEMPFQYLLYHCNKVYKQTVF
jgi:hypothetical protein